MTRRSRRVVASVAAALAAGLVAGCLPQPATSQGQSIFSLYGIAFAMSVVVAALVWGLLTWSIFRYRRGKRAATNLPPQTKGSLVLEIVWFVGPTLAVAFLFVVTLITLNTVNAEPASGAVQLDVQAFRWGWTFEYPNDGVSVTGVLEPGPVVELPVNTPIEINLTAADVIHSWFVPQFLFKRDAIPGHPTSFSITIDQPGSYAGQCAEFCGIGHSQMPFTIEAVSSSDYQAWLFQERSTQSTAPTSSSSPESTP